MKTLKILLIKSSLMLLFIATVLFSCKKQEISVDENLKAKKIALEAVQDPELLPSEDGGGGGGTSPTSYVPPGFGTTTPNANYYALHRLFNAYTYVHMLAGPTEALSLLNTFTTHFGPSPMPDWTYEGALGNIFISQQPETVPLYRYYRGSNEDHYYSTVNAVPAGYVSEGIQGYVYNSGPSTASLVSLRKPIYVYSTTSGKADHVYTTNFNELGNGNSHWRYEGIAFWLQNQ